MAIDRTDRIGLIVEKTVTSSMCDNNEWRCSSSAVTVVKFVGER